MIEGFYGNAVLMLKDGIEQSPVRVSAGVTHNQHLKRCCHQELQHIVIMPRFQIFHRFDVSQLLIVVSVENVLIVPIQLINIAKDNTLWVFQIAMNIVEVKVEIAVHPGSGSVVETQ